MKDKDAIVLGGGFAGLVTARVLADHFKRVHVIERDIYPSEAVPRKRVPQGTQAHVLLARGLKVLEGMFPSLRQAFDEAGVPESDFGMHVRQTLGDTIMPPVQAGIPMRCSPRPQLEAIIRAQVVALANVTVHEGCSVKGLKAGADGDISHVEITDADGLHHLMESALVVDCRGRSADLPAWLESQGFGRPRTELVNAGFVYATAIFKPERPFNSGDPAAWFCAPRFPDFPVAGLAMRMPDGQLMATLITAPGHKPPEHIEDLLSRFSKLPLPDLWPHLRGAEAVGPICLYKATMNRRHYVEELPRWPGRFIALGDTVCALNPRFGQGMTVASVEAEALSDYLKRYGTGGLAQAPARTSRDIQRHICAVVKVPWMMACSEDLAWLPDRKLSLVDRLSAWYMQGLVRASSESGEASVRFMRIAQMLDGPLHALHPALSLRVLGGALRPAPRALPQTA